MDTELIRRQLTIYIRNHGRHFFEFPTIESQLLELGTLVLVAEHYRLEGYTVTPMNLIGRHFRVKRSSAGYPWNFSWFAVSGRAQLFDIHANLAVEGAYRLDGAKYVVDVGVCNTGAVPRAKPRSEPWHSVANAKLATWVEAKKLVVYPMLLAQFIGIVHEISPHFLGGPNRRGFRASGHFPPALVTTGHFTGGSAQIVSAFKARRFRTVVVPDLDVALASMKEGRARSSPFRR